MTVVVVDRLKGLVAADRFMMADNCSVSNVIKIVRGPGGDLAGAAGDADTCSLFLKWVVAGSIGSLPKFKPAGFYGIMLTTARDIMLWQEALVPDTIEDDFWAIGAGALAALGAYHMRANAWQAVDVACKVCPGTCGGGIDILNLDGTGHFTPL